MVSSKSKGFPISLGKSKKNTIQSQGGSVKSGRWVDVEETIGNPPSWIKVESEGYLLDRSLSDIKYTIENDDYAVVTRYTHPKSQKPIIDMLPINSTAFDMDEEPPSMQSCYLFEPSEELEEPIFKFPSIAIFASLASYMLKKGLEGDSHE